MFSSIKVEIEPLTESEQNITAWFKRYELRFRYQMLQYKVEGKDSKDSKDSKPDPKLELLPIFLSSEVLVAFEAMEHRNDYEEVKRALINRYGMKPRVAYERFTNARLQPGMSVDAFADSLRQSLVAAVPGLSPDQIEDFVLHQFLLSLSQEKKEQLLLATEREGVKLRLGEVLEKARSITLVPPIVPMYVSQNAPAVSAAIKTHEGSKSSKRRCFNCNTWGHISAECKKPKKPKNLGKGAPGSPQ